jgi:hypothetical protein
LKSSAGEVLYVCHLPRHLYIYYTAKSRKNAIYKAMDTVVKRLS